MAEQLGLFLIEGEIKCSTLAHNAFAPYLTPVPVDDALDKRQTNASTLEITIGMQPLKGAEQFSSIRHIKPGAIVIYIIKHAPVFVFRSKFYAGE